MTNLRDSEFVSILPFKDNRTIALSYAVKKQIEILVSCIEKVKFLCDIDKASEDVLDTLAVELRTPLYEQGFTLEVKRNMIKNTIGYFMTMGTAGAIEQLMTDIGGVGTVVEWYEYSGEPFHFRVIAPSEYVTPEQIQEFIKKLDGIKRKSAWCDGVAIQPSIDAQVVFCGITLQIMKQITIQ